MLTGGPRLLYRHETRKHTQGSVHLLLRLLFAAQAFRLRYHERYSVRTFDHLRCFCATQFVDRRLGFCLQSG
jgi:hypothetical protein